jgi:DNA-binding FrmR family transcriptional regulator
MQEQDNQMEWAELDATVRRLRRIEGQVRGLERMLVEGRECEDVLTQLMAVRSGLEQVSLLLLDHHCKDCLLGGSEIDPDRLEGLRQTLRLWARFGAPAAQVPD